jgi:hypothetical protein
MALGEPLSYRIRGRLALLTVQHVLAIWENQCPDDPQPQRVLARAEAVLAGVVSPEIGAQEAYTIEGNFDASYADPDTSGVNLDAGYVLLAAIEALFEASKVYRFSGDEEDEYPYDPETSAQTSEDEIDYTCMDTAGWASYAYAGGPWAFSFDPAKSKEFWEWWLSKAILEAWDIARD